MSGSKNATAGRKVIAGKKVAAKKEHGVWLSAFLIFAALQAILYSFLILYLRAENNESSPAWVYLVVFLVSLAHLVAVYGIWRWKKWGIQLYVVATLVGVAVGLLLTGTQLAVFHGIIFLAILGYLIKDRRPQFT
jgi:uncharacterized membrane protein YidH (DUF202 family)